MSANLGLAYESSRIPRNPLKESPLGINMAEPDHLIQALPVSAKPITADRLLELEERQRRHFVDNTGKQERIKTGCLEIDHYVLCGAQDRLNGGFERGIVVGISAADGDEYEGRGSRMVGLALVL